MQVIDSDFQFPISSAVVRGGRILQAVVTGISHGERHPVPGETREITAELEPAA